MTTIEANILARVIAPAEEGLSPEAARSILRWKFPQADVEQMTNLSQKANAGTLTSEEQEELDSYERVGHLVAIVQSKARCCLSCHDDINAAIREGLADVDAGRQRPSPEVMEELRQKHGITSE
jgi:hypothetical protein